MSTTYFRLACIGYHDRTATLFTDYATCAAIGGFSCRFGHSFCRELLGNCSPNSNIRLQYINGVKYAFPKAMAHLGESCMLERGPELPRTWQAANIEIMVKALANALRRTMSSQSRPIKGKDDRIYDNDYSKYCIYSQK